MSQVTLASEDLGQVSFPSIHFNHNMWYIWPEVFYLPTILKASKEFWFWQLLSFRFTKWTGWSKLSWTGIAGKWCELPLHSAQQRLSHDSVQTKLQCCQSPALPPPCCWGLLYSNKPLYSSFLSHMWYLDLGLCLWAVWIQYIEPENLINSGLWMSSVLGSNPCSI